MYLVVELLYYVFFITFHIAFASTLAKIFVFVTSPFSLLENLSNIYSTPAQGLFLNLAFLLVIIYASDMLYSKSKEIKKYFKSGEQIWIGIIASYLISPIFWYLYGLPSSGTSIIGVNLLTFAVICLILDIPARIKKLKKAIRIKNRRFTIGYSAVLALYALGFILIYLVYSAYGYRLTHLVGGIVGLVIFLAVIVIRFYKRCTKDNVRN